MYCLTNTEKTVLAHLTQHHRIQPMEPEVVKIFGGDHTERRRVLTSMRDRGLIQHFRRPYDGIEFICPSNTGSILGMGLLQAYRAGTWAPENIDLSND